MKIFEEKFKTPNTLIRFRFNCDGAFWKKS